MYQLAYFSIFRESLSVNALLGKNQLAVTRNVKHSTATFNQLDMCMGIRCLQLCFHPGSLG